MITSGIYVRGASILRAGGTLVLKRDISKGTFDPGHMGPLLALVAGGSAFFGSAFGPDMSNNMSKDTHANTMGDTKHLMTDSESGDHSGSH